MVVLLQVARWLTSVVNKSTSIYVRIGVSFYTNVKSHIMTRCKDKGIICRYITLLNFQTSDINILSKLSNFSHYNTVGMKIQFLDAHRNFHDKNNDDS